ncbi:hypothetical protein FBZ98_109213 [Rhizobium sp. ERR 922]|nr:hypothetical protein FBZ99_103760 [Rhizobium sp. ERR1071]TWB48070.1 hypothetical protein FBZ98_109213 [Rhizobium sp. ERR 922]TWB89679.1 hypothetical protein FBZ97_110213 [Rhizobium sp. ERR 942]
MFTRAIFSAVFLVLIGLSISACSTSGDHNSGGGMTLNAPPTGGGY